MIKHHAKNKTYSRMDSPELDDVNPDQDSRVNTYHQNDNEQSLSAEELEEIRFNQMMETSQNITRSLFGKQIFTYSDGLTSQDSNTLKRREALKRIKSKDQYGDLIDKLMKQMHPLVRPTTADPLLNLSDSNKFAYNNNDNNNNKHSSNNINNTAQNINSNTTNNNPPELAIVLRDTNKSIGQTRIEIAAKSARALVLPWMKSIDRKSLAMDEIVRPEWHPPWKLYRMISVRHGWVHSLAVDPSNVMFASGCRDGVIKIWDLASGLSRHTLTGHISGVRGLAFSDRHPYLFSCGDDKMVKCWDLETNQSVRHYHGHLSGVYSLCLHPTENILITGGRDSVGRVWDIRSKEQIHCFSGHTNSIGTIQCQEKDPQVITGSYDTTIKLWDLKMGKSINTLTHHKKSVRGLAIRHDHTSFASGATDNIKQWSLPEGNFIQNLSGHNSIINCLATNKYNVLVSGADNGTLFFWDWRTGHNFQRLFSPAQKGSIESEAGILCMTFDKTGSRLITGECDKTIKMFREDPNATEDTHPIDWKPDIMKRSRF